MEDSARAEFEKLSRMGQTLDSNLFDLERQFSDMASTLTLPPSQEDLDEAHRILDSLTDYWKNLCTEIETATVQMDGENADLSEQLKKAETNLKVMQEKTDKCVKYATGNLNISLSKLPSLSNQELNKSADGDSPSSQQGQSDMPRAEADSSFLMTQNFSGLQMSPGDDNSDNTVLELS